MRALAISTLTTCYHYELPESSGDRVEQAGHAGADFIVDVLTQREDNRQNVTLYPVRHTDTQTHGYTDTCFILPDTHTQRHSDTHFILPAIQTDRQTDTHFILQAIQTHRHTDTCFILPAIQTHRYTHRDV